MGRDWLVMNRHFASLALLALSLILSPACGDDVSEAAGSGGAGATGGSAGGGGSAGSAGSGGTNSAGFGSLTGSGPDTAIVGTTYTPTLATAIINDVTGAVSWSFSIGQGLTVGFLGDGTPSSASLIFVSPSNVDEVYSYFLACQLEPAECENVEVDLVAKSLTFDNATLSIIPTDSGPTNIATAPLVVDGTVTWN